MFLLGYAVGFLKGFLFVAELGCQVVAELSWICLGLDARLLLSWVLFVAELGSICC